MTLTMVAFVVAAILGFLLGAVGTIAFFVANDRRRDDANDAEGTEK